MKFRAEVLQRCQEDTLYWYDNFAWTFDPRKTPSELPFMPYEGKQIAFLRVLDDLLKNPRDLFIDKCRDIGGTALFMNWVLKQWLFNDNFNARVGSRKEDYVDSKNDPDTLFYKADYTLMRLPSWMKPEAERSYMKMIRADNSNTLVGESANPNFARGGRQTVVFFDEIGFWPWARSAWESAGDVTEIRVAMTTPPQTGRSSFAYKLFTGQAGHLDKFEFEYTDIPAKDNAWIKKQKDRRSAEEFEREILKSYQGTSEGKVYFSTWKMYVKEGDYAYNPELPLYIAWDFGLDSTAMIWIQKDMSTNQNYIIDSYQNNNKSIDYYIPFVTGKVLSGIEKYGEREIKKIREHELWRRDVTHFGDYDVHKRNLTDKNSAFEVLRKHNVYVQARPWAGRKHRDLREKTKLGMRRLYVDESHNEEFIDCVLSARYPETTETAQPTSEKDKPIHDWTSHFRSALEYYFDCEEMPPDTRYDDVKVPTYKPRGGYR